MGLAQRLQQIAGSLGLVRVVSVPNKAGAPARSAAPVEMRSVKLEELASEINLEQVEALNDDPGELTLELHRVIEAAGVEFPDHGWTVERVHQATAAVIETGADREAVRRAVVAQLAADQVSAEEIVRDALARDRAIDAFEQFVRQKHEQRRVARQHDIDELERQRHELSRQIQTLEAEQRVDADQLGAWITEKRALEDRWVSALSYLVEGESPITRDPE